MNDFQPPHSTASHFTMSNESILHKRNVLITNGSSALSQALCEQLIEIHKCRVALVTTSEERTESARHQLYCDISSRKEVTDLASKLTTQFGSIELVIHQECGNDFGKSTEQMERFVSQTSNDILGYVNLLTCFVPDMLHHGSGRIVSVKNTPSKVHAAIDCQPEYDDLVESIYRAQAETVPSPVVVRGPENIRLITISTNQTPQQQAAKLGPNLNLTDRELAQRILRGIESDQAHVQVHARRNLFEFCSTNIVQLAAFGLDKLQLRKSQKIPIKVQ